jgi:hypothetical protein
LEGSAEVEPGRGVHEILTEPFQRCQIFLVPLSIILHIYKYNASAVKLQTARPRLPDR